jgi:hypothetical protein
MKISTKAMSSMRVGSHSVQKAERFDPKRILRSVVPLGYQKRETYLDSLSLLVDERTANQLIPYFLEREQASQYLIRPVPARCGLRLAVNSL